MAKTSQLYNFYADRLNRVQSADELLGIAREINASSLKNQEKAALALFCLWLGKRFDKKGKSIHAENSALECPDQV